MIPAYAKSFSYQISWKSSSIHAGDHRGSQRGLGFEYRGNVSLIDHPDARRMDLRQTLRDPYEQIQVKLFNQDNTTPIFAVCDCSSSMQYKGYVRKLDLAMEVAASVAYSAFNAGDVFSLIGYNHEVLEDFTLPLSHHVYQSFELIDQLKNYKQMHIDADGILEVPQYLSQHRGLVFWISDFHMPLELLEQALNAMSVHQIVPVVLWDDQEYKKLPKFGFGNMLDPETGMSRSIFFRDSVRKQFEAVFMKRKEQLENIFASFDYQPIYMKESFNAELMSEYFEQFMG